MGRYSRLIDKPSLTNISSRGDNLRNTILSSFNLAQHFTNFRRKRSFEKFLDKQLCHQSLEQSEPEVVDVGVVLADSNNIISAQRTVVLLGEQKRVFEGSNNWRSTAMAGFQEDMNAWDLSGVKQLQTLKLSGGDVNSVAFGRNFILATGSGYDSILCRI